MRTLNVKDRTGKAVLTSNREGMCFAGEVVIDFLPMAEARGFPGRTRRRYNRL